MDALRITREPNLKGNNLVVGLHLYFISVSIGGFRLMTCELIFPSVKL